MLIAAVIKGPIVAVLAAQQLRGQQYVINLLLRFLTAAICQDIVAVSTQNHNDRYFFNIKNIGLLLRFLPITAAIDR